MPEGDTILRAARTLHRVLAGRTVTAIASPLARVETAVRRHALVGSRVEQVEARGKHLILRFSCGVALHTHQRMTGSWHLYRAASRWRRPAHEMRVRLDAGDVTAVCFLSPVVELLTAEEERRHPALSSLGPDLLAARLDLDQARLRLRRRSDEEIGTALMDQGALAGIGNVYKSEVLYLCGVDPFASVASLGDTVLDELVRVASAQMARNLGPGSRHTTPTLSGGALWVYKREGLGCRRCGTSVRRRRQGDAGRSTYWCPRCQPPQGL
jgi:endonuclease-8